MELLKNFLIAYLSIGLQLVEISHQQSCASWTANPGFHSFNGVHYPTYSTVLPAKICVSAHRIASVLTLIVILTKAAMYTLHQWVYLHSLPSHSIPLKGRAISQ